MCSAHLTRSASLWCLGMSTAKCWNFCHIGVAPSSASGCKVSSTPRAPPLLRSFGTCRARILPIERTSLGVFPWTSHLWLYTRPLAAGVRGEDPKGGHPLGPRVLLASRRTRRCGVAPPCLHRPTRSVDRVRPHMTDREADALLYYPLPCLYARAVVWMDPQRRRAACTRAQCPRFAGGPVAALAYLPSQLTLTPTLSIQASPAA